MSNHKRYILIIFSFIILMLSLVDAIWPLGKKDKESKKQEQIEQEELKRSKEEIKKIKSRHGIDLYVGEGLTEIKGGITLGEAKSSAKQRALEDLSTSIKVRIRGTIKDELKLTPEKGTEERFESMVNSYVDSVLSVVKDESFYNYPKEDVITVIVYISKSAYDEKVQKEVRAKIDRIVQYINEGTKSLKLKSFTGAIEHFLNAERWLSEDFGDLPVKEDINKDGIDDDLGAVIETNLTNIVQDMKLESLDEKIVYDTNGVVSKNPTVYLSYEEKTGKTTPMINIPLKATFIKGEGKITDVPLKTDRLGVVRIPVERIDPEYKEAVVRVEVDMKSLGLEGKLSPSPCDLNLTKKRAIAYSVNFFNSGVRETPTSIIDSVKSTIVEYGYATVPVNINGREVVDNELKAVADLNVDYLVLIVASASGGKVGDYEMYYSNVASKVLYYEMPDRNLIFSMEGPSSKGYGTSLSSAGWDALGKIKSNLMIKLKDKIKELK
jgi:hypothetical protein